MMYREFLVMRKAVLWYAVVFLAIVIVATIASAGKHSSTNTDLTGLVVPAGWCAAIFGAIFGVALGNASREPARIMWTLPTARWRSGLAIIGVDALGIVVAFIIPVVAALAILGLEYARGCNVIVRWNLDWYLLVVTFAFVYASYGWSVVLGIVGRSVPYLGIVSLPALLLWEALSGSNGWFGDALRAPIAANPYAILAAFQALGTIHRPVGNAMLEALAWMGTAWELPVLMATAVGTCAIAVVFWQRSQVLSV